MQYIIEYFCINKKNLTLNNRPILIGGVQIIFILL